MRQTRSQSRTRCQSSDSNNSCIISSILKKPSDVKLKHQRSVRFEEPDTSPTLPKHNISVRQVEFSPNISFNFSPSPNSKNLNSPKSNPKPAKSEIFQESGQSQPERFIKESNPKRSSQKSPSRIITLAKFKNSEAKSFQNAAPKTIKLECRDASFYSKLNYYLNVKSSLSPLRSGSSDYHSRKGLVNQSFEKEGLSAELKTSGKLKPNLPLGKKHSKARNQVMNLLN